MLTSEALARADELAGLEWDAPPECPSESEVRSAVDQWLTAPAGELDLRAIHASARVRADPGGFRLELTFESKSGTGHETLVAPKCETLADIVALKVALAADPVGALETAAGPPDEPHRAKTKRREHAYGLRITGGAGFGPLPGAGPAAALVGSVHFRGARIELGAGYWFPESAHYESLPSVGADFTLVAGMVRGCAAPRLGAVELPICGGLEAGDLRGKGFGVPTVEAADRPWIALVFGPAIAIPVADPVFLWLEGDAVLGLIRPSGYGVRNLETLYAPEIGAARVWAGLEVRF